MSRTPSFAANSAKRPAHALHGHDRRPAARVQGREPTTPTGHERSRGQARETTSSGPFLPPHVLPGLDCAVSDYPGRFCSTARRVNRDIIFRTYRRPSQGRRRKLGAAEWHNVVVAGGGLAGGFYYAMDVSDPYNPTFLWQLATTTWARPLFGLPPLRLRLSPPLPTRRARPPKRFRRGHPAGRRGQGRCHRRGARSRDRPVTSRTLTPPTGLEPTCAAGRTGLPAPFTIVRLKRW